MVSVMVIRPFRHLGRNVFDGQWIDLDPIDAAVKAREGFVSLLHGNAYQTREMVAAEPPQVVALPACHSPASTIVEPVKRRRGRGRKAR